ncbi:serine protease Do [Granulicatella balaenopterae]|uniref:Serine protease Do n=1 Tax=Granulicatella balaenopterae TaxID=137733 RepID=A0A1H9M893_9LACT|nr:trypsin-like peptidase domain-containing protein [Granulicatella balaenopterae]SER19990.1 serine protease Do [Granulicatella balaenopterae]
MNRLNDEFNDNLDNEEELEQLKEEIVQEVIEEETDKQQKTTKKSKPFFSGFIGGVVGFVACSAIMVLTNQTVPTLSSSETPTIQTTQTAPLAKPVNNDITGVVNQTKEAVVSIVNMQHQHQLDLFGRSFSQNDGELTKASEGSGVIYKVEGDYAYIVTNNHVISQSEALQVLLADGTKADAELVGADSWTDLAVIRIPANNVKVVAQFGNSDEVVVGERALAIGSPLGSEFATSVTSGIVSAVDRSVDTDIDGDGRNDWTMTAIQTDAAINPGNSGGALINESGQVIGINSMKISNSAVEGMGFAIPSNEVVSIINQLEKTGEVDRPVLGIGMNNVVNLTSAAFEQLKLPKDLAGGVIILNVQSKSSAEEAGLQNYDVIVKMDGEEVNNVQQLRKQLYSHQIGDDITVSYYRDGKLQEATVHLTTSQSPSL